MPTPTPARVFTPVPSPAPTPAEAYVPAPLGLPAQDPFFAGVEEYMSSQAGEATIPTTAWTGDEVEALRPSGSSLVT